MFNELGWKRFREHLHPVTISTGPAKAFFIGRLDNVNNSPTVTGCFVFSPASRRPGSKKPGNKNRYWVEPMFALVKYPGEYSTRGNGAGESPAT